MKNEKDSLREREEEVMNHGHPVYLLPQLTTGELLKDKNPVLIRLTCPTPTKVLPGLLLSALHAVASRPSSHSLCNLRP